MYDIQGRDTERTPGGCGTSGLMEMNKNFGQSFEVTISNPWFHLHVEVLIESDWQ